MRLIDADALMDDIKRDSKKAIDEGDKVGSFWLGHAAGLAIKQPTIQPEVLACGNGELVAQPEPTDISAKEAVYNLAEKIGIHQLFALTVELRGEPIQPEPKEGHWIPHKSPDGGEQYECSRCGVLWEFNDGTPEDNEAFYCPKCGADMRGERE